MLWATTVIKTVVSNKGPPVGFRPGLSEPSAAKGVGLGGARAFGLGGGAWRAAGGGARRRTGEATSTIANEGVVSTSSL